LQSAIRRAAQDCRGRVFAAYDQTRDPAPAPADVERKLPLSRERAYRAFLDALRREPGLKEGSDAEVFRWLKLDEAAEDNGLPASCETFQRYLREARAHYDAHKNTPRIGRTGRSVVRVNEV
jgi:hypothetical protein